MINYLTKRICVTPMPYLLLLVVLALTPWASNGQEPEQNNPKTQPPTKISDKAVDKPGVQPKKNTRRSCIYERWDGFTPYYDFYDDAGRVVKSIEVKKFKDQVPNPYRILSSSDMNLTSIKEGSYRLDDLDIDLKKTLLHQVLPGLPDESAFENMQSVSTYDGPFCMDKNKRFIVYGNHAYIVDENEWGPAWAETTIYIYNNLGDQIGKIADTKYINAVAISDDGKYLTGEVQSFIAGDGGDLRTEEFRVYDVRSGSLIGIVKCRVEGYVLVDFGYDNNLFKITIPTGEGGHWRICIDPVNKKSFKKRYDTSDTVWNGIKFLQFKTAQTPDGLEENLAGYEVSNF